MKWLNWQKKIIDDKESEVIEVIGSKGAGKDILSLGWVVDDADVSIIIVNDYYKKISLIDNVDKFGFNPKGMYIVYDLSHLRGLDCLRDLTFKSNKKVKVVVSEYFFQPEITLNELDQVIGSENYKVMFIGSRKECDDKFKIPFSKKYNVDLLHLFVEGDIDESYLLNLLAKENKEYLYTNFCSPFEIN